LAYRDSVWAVMEGPVTVPHGAANNGFDVRVSGTGSVSIPKIRAGISHDWRSATSMAAWLCPARWMPRRRSAPPS
jgi:hypothetical protein